MSAGPTYIHLPAGFEPPDIGANRSKMVVIIEQSSSAEWQEKICAWIVDSGCLSAMTWGKECEIWHDAVDYANLEKFDYKTIPDDKFIMTTWHADEPIEEVFWYAQYCAFHPNFELNKSYIIDISSKAREEKIITAYEYAGSDAYLDSVEV